MSQFTTSPDERELVEVPPTGARPTGSYWPWAICCLLVLLVGAVFGQTVFFDFIEYDVHAFVYENPHVNSGLTLPGIWWALTDGPFHEWCPMSVLSHMLDCELYGLNPAGHYLTNVLLHASSSVLLFLVLLRITRGSGHRGPEALWPSAWVAAVFAVHPLHVESVAWLAERRDVLSGLFFMLTLGAYARYAERPSPARYLAVAALLALGLMSKPIVVTVPFVLLLLDFWPLGRVRAVAAWRLIVEKLPLVAMSAATCLIVLATHASMQQTDHAERLPLASRAANAVVSYAAYVGQSFYPVDLAAFYPHLGVHPPLAPVAGSLTLLIAVTVVATYCRRERPYLLVGWLWFLGMLIPVSGLLQFGALGRADRYTYLSQIGLSIAVAWLAWSVWGPRRSTGAARWRMATLALAVVSGGTLLVLAAVAWRQTSYWRGDEILWRHSVAATGPNQRASYCLGAFLAKQGETDEAIESLTEALACPSFNPGFLAETHDLLAKQLDKQGKVDEALDHYEQAVRIFPEGPEPRACLARAIARGGDLRKAIAEWREAVKVKPDFYPARIGLADALFLNGEYGEAIYECNQIFKSHPGALEAVAILGAALAAIGQTDEALVHLDQVLAVDRNNARAQAAMAEIAKKRRGEQ